MIIFISLNVFICSLVVMIFDIKFRVIPNALVFSFTLIALVSHLIVNGWQGLVFSTTGLVMGFFLLFIFYLFKMVGAGDVKYLACLGAWLGTSIVVVFILTSFLGGLLALFYLLKSKYELEK
jgi:prepilin peptidase CpaA